MMIRKLLFTYLLCCFFVVGFSQNAALNDYRSLATGNWNTPGTWQKRTSTNTWVTATVVPTSADNVYIQQGHTITVNTVNAVCKDLQVSNNATSAIYASLVIGANTLSVSGKLRAYTGSLITSSIDDVFYTQTSVTANLSSTLITTSTGVLKFVGSTSRNLIEAGDWGANGNAAIAEIAMDPGVIGTFLSGAKFKSITVTSGTFALGNSTTTSISLALTGTGTCLRIKPSARLALYRSGFASNGAIYGTNSTTKCDNITLDAGGTIEVQGTDVCINCTSFNNSGTIIYYGGTGTLLQPNIAGAFPITTYKNLILAGTGTKTIPSGTTITVSDTLKLEGTKSCYLVSLLGSKLNYVGTNSVLVWNSISNSTWTLPSPCLEWPRYAGPKTIEFKSYTVQFPSVTDTSGSRTVTGNLIFSGGIFNINASDSLIMANGSNIYRKSIIGGIKFGSSTGAQYVIGTPSGGVGQKVNLYIDAGTGSSVTEGDEFNPNLGFGRINLNISPGNTYTTLGGRTAYNLNNSGVLNISKAAGIGTFFIKGDITGIGVIQSRDTGMTLQLDSVSTSTTSQNILLASTGERFRNFIVNRYGTTFTINNPLLISRYLYLRNGILNDNGKVISLGGSVINDSADAITPHFSKHKSIGAGKILMNASLPNSQTTASIDTSIIFGNLEIDRDVTANGNFTVENDLTLTSGTLDCNSHTVLARANIYGTATQTGSGKIKMTGVNKTISNISLSNLEIESPAVITTIGGGTLNINSNLQVTSGTFNAGTSIVAVDGSVIVNSGAFNIGTNDMTIGTNLQTSSTGTFNAAAKTITVNGNISGAGSIITTGRFKKGGTAKNILGNYTFNELEILTGASLDSCNAEISGTLYMNGSYVAVGSGNTLTFNDNSSIIRTSGDLNLNSGTVVMGNTSSGVIDVTINGNLTSSNELPASHLADIDLTINSGNAYTLKSNNKTVRNLTISNGSLNTDPADPTDYSLTSIGTVEMSGNFTLNTELGIKGALSFTSTASGKTLSTNDNLVIKSTESATGYIAEIANGNNITGKATVERYLQNVRAWRFLHMPTKHDLQSIKQSWMEGGANNSNPNPGYGIQITDNRTSWASNGFDAYSQGSPSVKLLNPATNLWEGIVSTNQNFQVGKGYMTFVRGNRSATSMLSPLSSTVVREKGTLNIGNVTFNNLGTATGQFIGVGNPYASAISLVNITSSNLDRTYYVWDPKLGGDYGYGRYQTITVSGSTVSVSPGGGSYTSNKNIESGQGFFVRTNGGIGSITFKESDKENGSYLVSREGSMVSSIRTNLSRYINGEAVLLDGTLTVFDSSQSNLIDKFDGKKMYNATENLGTWKGNQVLAIENRNLINEIADTIFLYTGQMKTASYHLDIIPDNISHKKWIAFLRDNYLNTLLPLSLVETNGIDFFINSDPASYNPSRFYIIFKQNPNIVQVNDDAEIDNTVIARNLYEGINNSTNSKVLISVTPNPVGFDRRLYVTLSKQTYSSLHIKLMDMLGRVVFSKKQANPDNNNDFMLTIPSSIQTGNYLLVIYDDLQQVLVKKLLIK